LLVTEPLVLTQLVHTENMIAGNDFVCLDGLKSSVVLKGEILSDGPCPVAHEKVRVGQVTLANNVVDEVVQCRLIVELKYLCIRDCQYT
jgi:hypothetical protein